MPTEPLNLGDSANPTPCADPAPVACAPDPGVAEGIDQDCGEEQCDDEESYVEPWTDYPDGRYDPWAEDHVEPAPQRVLYLLGAPQPDNDCDGPGWCDRCSPDPCTGDCDYSGDEEDCDDA